MERRHLDQTGQVVTVNFPPQRIISLVPSQTELLFDLGLADRVVGITRFCVHPREWFDTKTRVGGTKNFDFNLIAKLKPDLIIGNKEENYEDGVSELRKKFPLWVSDVTDWNSALHMIRALGELTGKTIEAEAMATTIEARFAVMPVFAPMTALYLIWRKPWMAAGKNTFIDTMMTRAGWSNCITTLRYPELSAPEIASLHPQWIVLPSEPFPFQQKHANELQQIVPEARIRFVDGEMFSWYGSRLLKAPEYLAQFANTEIPTDLTSSQNPG